MLYGVSHVRCVIGVPATLDLPQVAQFSLSIREVPDADTYLFDYSRMSTVSPFGMLLLGATIRRFMEERNGAEFFGQGFNRNDYAAHMGFFQSIGLDFGKCPGEAHANGNYVPITEIQLQDLQRESRQYQRHVGETIERRSRVLARVLSRGEENLYDHLTYAIREIVRNTFEHSGADSVWVAGQFWPTKDLVEVAVLDEGVGIRRGLTRNKRLRVEGDADALRLAIEPGISGTAIRYHSDDDMWANSGFGLYMTSSICMMGGSFVLCSGEQAMHLEGSKTQFRSCQLQGTAIRMRLRPSRLGLLSEITSRLVREGEQKARKNRRQAILTASKVSSGLLLTEDVLDDS